ncbi:hypothetical protein LTS10_012550 [Elasticomyces elasticus]|nr:hypothetical protein LTS10_012550 [Elasticomyces elasticus]
MADFTGKTIAITGASGGIGSATADYLASKGATLSLADMDLPVLERLAETLRGRYNSEVLTTQLDVADAEQVNRWLSTTVAHFKTLSGAANIAGTVGKEFGLNLTTDVSDEDFDMVMRINVKGIMVCQRAELRLIEEGGAIVNVASVAGKMGQPRSLSYTASKHAVIGLTRVAASENGSRNSSTRGSIDTAMLAHALGAGMPKSDTSGCPMNRAGKPREVAALISFLLSTEASFINGSVQTIDGGLTP